MLEDTNILNDLNESDKKTLLASVMGGSLSHAYLFVGTDRSSVEQSCKEFLCAVLSSRVEQRQALFERISKNTHSDVVDIYPDGASIKIRQLRSIIGFLQTSPTESSYNIVVIHDAQRMTVESQNFLLKTIEEPPEGAMIVLLASSQDNILGTVLSRVTPVYLKSKGADLDNKEIRSFVSNRMSKMILEGSVEGIFSTAKALLQSVNDKSLSQKDVALLNLEYVYSFFVQMLIYNRTKRVTDYTKEEFGILSGKVGIVCNINIINIIENTMNDINKNASVQLSLEAMLIDILEECNAENSWNQI